MVMLVLASVILVADEPPPPPPPPPVEIVIAEPEAKRWRWLGIRFGLANLEVEGHDRTLTTFGLQWGTSLVGDLRGFVEYELAAVMAGDAQEDVLGRAHSGRGGLRYPILDKTVDRGEGPNRLYADLDVSGGATLLSDNLLGAHVMPVLTVGLRLGFEIVPRDRETPSRHALDFHFMFRALVTPDDVSFFTGFGFEWGSR